MDEQDAESIINKFVETTEEEGKKKTDDHVSYLFIVLFYLMGTASFAPHNFYVTANEYWMYKFRDPNVQFNASSTHQKTLLQKNFTANLGITGNIGTISFLVLCFIFRKKISIQTKIVGSLSMLLVLFVITLIFIFVDTDSWQTPFFSIALGIGALLSGLTAVLLITLFQLAIKFPPRCLVAQLAGQNICGILAAIVQIIALGAEPSVQGTASLYYGVATATIAAILIFYLFVVKTSEEFRSKLYKKPKENTTETKQKKKPKIQLDIMKRVFKKLALLVAALILSVANSGILHPGLTALIESSNKGSGLWADTYFLPVCVFLLYNTFEFIGREASNHFPKLTNLYIIFTTSCLRLLLLPLIILCNIQPRNHLPVVFHDDAYFICFFTIFSLSGGYLANIGVLAMNKYCEPEERMVGTMFIVLIMIIVVPLVSILSATVVNVI